jgi:hypothetical protein
MVYLVGALCSGVKTERMGGGHSGGCGDRRDLTLNGLSERPCWTAGSMTEPSLRRAAPPAASTSAMANAISTRIALSGG